MFSTLKRRISDYDEAGEVQLSLKRKKLRLLPIRTASAPSTVASMPSVFPAPAAYDSNPVINIHHPDTSTLTPAQSDDEDNSGQAKKFAASPLAIPAVRPHSFLPQQQQQQQQQPQTEDHDMLDMGVEYSASAAAGLLPAPLPTGRIPTPRYGSFSLRPAAAQDYGCAKTTGLAHDGLVRASASASSFNQHHHHHHHAVENRMLPSPIEEAGRWDTSQLRSSVLSMYDAAAAAATTSTITTTSYSSPSSSSSSSSATAAVAAPTAFIPSAGAPWLANDDGDVTMDEARSPSGYDRRSMSSSNSSTPARPVDRSSRGGGGGGRPTLVMGYRADCEKCKARVPGHYSHIIRS